MLHLSRHVSVYTLWVSFFFSFLHGVLFSPGTGISDGPVCLNVVDGARATCVALGNTGNEHCFSTMTVICRMHNCGCAQARAAALPSHMHAISVLSDKSVVEAAVALGSSENGDWGGVGGRRSCAEGPTTG